MFSLAFSDLMDPQKIDKLKQIAKDKITVRGYKIDQVAVDPALKNRSWFLPINEIVSDYCPSNRYSFLKKYMPQVKIQLTWESHKGRVIDNLYKDLYEKFCSYIDSANIRTIAIQEELRKYQVEVIDKIKSEIEKLKGKMISPPNSKEIGDFVRDLNKLLNLEIESCAAIMDHKISLKKDINLKSEIKVIFPFIFKTKINAIDLGFSEGLEPDFIYRLLVIGEIKCGEWREFFRLSCAAYALAYEFEHRSDLDLGVVLNPIFDENRTVPLYLNSEISIIDDRYRKTVLSLRDKKLALMKEKQDPGTPENKDKCPSGCGYLNYCWGEEHE